MVTLAARLQNADCRATAEPILSDQTVRPSYLKMPAELSVLGNVAMLVPLVFVSGVLLKKWQQGQHVTTVLQGGKLFNNVSYTTQIWGVGLAAGLLYSASQVSDMHSRTKAHDGHLTMKTGGLWHPVAVCEERGAGERMSNVAAALLPALVGLALYCVFRTAAHKCVTYIAPDLGTQFTSLLLGADVGLVFGSLALVVLPINDVSPKHT